MRMKRIIILCVLVFCSLLLVTGCYPYDEWTTQSLTRTRKKQLQTYFSDYPDIGLKLGANFGIQLSEAHTSVEYHTVPNAPFSGTLVFESVPSSTYSWIHGSIFVRGYRNETIRSLTGHYYFSCFIDKNKKEYTVTLTDDYDVTTRTAGTFHIHLINVYEGSYKNWDPSNIPNGSWYDKDYDHLASQYFIHKLDPPNRLGDVFSVPKENLK